MRAVVITRPGGPEVLEIRDVDPPEPSGDDVLVRVRASGLNRADIHQRKGGYPAPPGSPADIPGLEYAGEIAGVRLVVTAPADAPPPAVVEEDDGPVIVEEHEPRYEPPVYGWVAVRPANCGTFKYWDGENCVDARYDPPPQD